MKGFKNPHIGGFQGNLVCLVLALGRRVRGQKELHNGSKSHTGLLTEGGLIFTVLTSPMRAAQSQRIYLKEWVPQCNAVKPAQDGGSNPVSALNPPSRK